MKISQRSTAVLAFFAVLCSSTAPAHAAKYKIHWLLGHPNLDYFEEAAANFKKTVEAGSHGDIAVDIVTTNDNSRETSVPGAAAPEIASRVESGEAEMGHSFTDVLGGVDPQLLAFEAPYLFRDYRHMEGVFEGPIGAELLDGLRAHHIVGLSFTYSGGASGVASASREIRRPEDLNGLRVGVYRGDAVNDSWLKSLGATPVDVGHAAEGALALQQKGELDAVAVTWRNFERGGLNQGFKYVNLMGSHYLVSVTYVNEKFYQSLPEAYRALIKDASVAAGRIERAKTIELNERSKGMMMAKGVHPVYLNEENKQAFVDAVKPAYARSIDKVLGKELIERITKTSDGPDQPSMPGNMARR